MPSANAVALANLISARLALQFPHCLSDPLERKEKKEKKTNENDISVDRRIVAISEQVTLVLKLRVCVSEKIIKSTSFDSCGFLIHGDSYPELSFIVWIKSYSILKSLSPLFP